MVVSRECFYFEHTGFLDESCVTLEVVCLSHRLDGSGYLHCED